MVFQEAKHLKVYPTIDELVRVSPKKVELRVIKNLSFELVGTDERL